MRALRGQKREEKVANTEYPRGGHAIEAHTHVKFDKLRTTNQWYLFHFPCSQTPQWIVH